MASTVLSEFDVILALGRIGLEPFQHDPGPRSSIPEAEFQETIRVK